MKKIKINYTGMKKFFSKLFFVAGVGLMLLPSCGGKEEQQATVPELAVITVGEEDATLETGYPATLHGKNDVEIRPQITGFITQVCVSEGQHVSKGQTLFVIDQVQLQAQVNAASAAVEQAKAGVAVCEANVNTARTNVTNNKVLLDKNIISQTAYQTSVDALNAAIAQLNQSKANLNAANAQLVSARRSLSFSVVTAPQAGIVGVIDFKEGALVSPSSLLTMLSNNSEMEAYFSMNEKEVLALTDNGKRSIDEAIKMMPAVSLKLSNGEIYPYQGKIISMSGVMDATTRSATVKASFPNTDGMLRSGSTGQVLIPMTTSNSIMVPQKATYEVQDMKFVYVVDKNNKVSSVPIKISDLNDGQNYIVTEGLNPGDVIVTEGVGITVKDGMEIKPKTASSTQK